MAERRGGGRGGGGRAGVAGRGAACSSDSSSAVPDCLTGLYTRYQSLLLSANGQLKVDWGGGVVDGGPVDGLGCGWGGRLCGIFDTSGPSVC